MDERENEIADEQAENSHKADHLKPWQWKKGQSGNPQGRYTGKSGKERVKEKIASMTDEEFDEFLEGQNKNDIWQMGEGRPDAKTDLTTGGKPLTKFVIELDDGTDDEDNQVEAHAETTTGIQIPTGQGN